MKLGGALAFTMTCALAACACKGEKGKGTGPGSGPVVEPAACDALDPRVRGLYQAQGGLGDDELPDAVALVIKECKAAPARVVPCVERVATAAELERTCLPALDDEGSEGKVFLSR